MRNLFVLCIAFLWMASTSLAQMGISTDNSVPDPSAMLDVKSNSKGMLVPRMTITERNAISNPAKGLLIFCTDYNGFYINYGTPASPDWRLLGSQWVTNGANIYYNSGNVGIGTTNPQAKLEVSSMLRIVPSTIPGSNCENLKGSIIYDTLVNEFCYCDGNSWKQLDGGGNCGCADNDGDGYDICDPGHPHDTDGLPADCNDYTPLVHPNANERCDGIDNNCNGQVDELFPELNSVCNAGLGACLSYGTYICSPDSLGVICSAIPGSPTYELCNGIDDDCDGQVDENYPFVGLPCDGPDPDLCAYGTWYCSMSGFGTECIENIHFEEICGNNFDDDCDGATDEDCP